MLLVCWGLNKMVPFKAPIDDILFSLTHVSGADEIEEWDADFVTEIATHFSALAEGELSSIDEIGDKQGATLTNGRVQMPECYLGAYKLYVEQGWTGLTCPEEYGGQGLGETYLSITSEIFSGACQSLQMVTGLVPGAIRTLLKFGTQAQKDMFIPPMANGTCLATMCLTEPAAGSDLSLIRTKAVQENGEWLISGEKIFISGGDQNLTDKILHLVLAKTEGSKISLFACSSHRTDTSRNSVKVERIEEKMGLHGSPTCHMVFDAAQATLVGEEGGGLRAMFTMMNHARVDVALQGVAHASRAHHIAYEYAKERVQGKTTNGEPAKLTDHADIRRMLFDMDSLAVGARAMAHIVMVMLERENNPALVEFLTPVIKVFCTDAGIQSAQTGMQVLGGYGYLQEYRVEQTYRDVRISAIYEGANGIHAAALSHRGLKGNKGTDAFTKYVAGIADDNNSKQLVNALDIWRNAAAEMRTTEHVDAKAHHFMQLTAHVFFLAVWETINAKSEMSSNPLRYQKLYQYISQSVPQKIKYDAERLMSAKDIQ